MKMHPVSYLAEIRHELCQTTHPRVVLVIMCVVLAVTLTAAGAAGATKTQEMATAISKAVGKVAQTYEGRQGPVVVFEENHASRLGQSQIAQMLVRLHKRYGLKAVALEGAFPSDGRLQAQWAANFAPQGRLEVAAQLLGEGEISAAEFMTLAFPEIAVEGIDDPTAYGVKLDNQASGAGTLALVKMAEKKLTPAQVAQVNQLVKANKVREAIETVVAADPWTKQTYTQMQPKCRVVSAEETIRRLKDIEREATTRGLSLEPQLTSGLHNLQRFFEAASKRSDSMVEKTLALATKNPGTPLAMIIGAAHTARVAELLRKADYSFAVVTPQALAQCAMRMDMDTKGYERKTQRQSVDAEGALGAMLDGRKKPQTVLNEPWFVRKATVYYDISELARETARAVASGQEPSFTTLVAALPPSVGLRIDPTQIRREGDEVIVPLEVQDKNQRWTTLWVRAGYSANVAPAKAAASYARQLQALLAEAQVAAAGRGGKPPGPPPGKRTAQGGGDGKKGGKKGGKPGGEGRTPKAVAKEISPGVYAIIAKDRAAVQSSVFQG